MLAKMIAASAVIYDSVKLEKNVVVGPGAIIYPNVTLADNTIIEPYCIIGQPSTDYYRDPDFEFLPTIIGKNSVIRSHSIVYAGSTLGDFFQAGHRILIREETNVGIHCRIGTGSELQGKLSVGDYTRLHSNVHIGQLSKIGNYVWIFPNVLFTNDPQPPVGEVVGPVVEDYAIIAAEAILYPGVRIGTKALVGVSSFVRNNVPPERVVMGNPAKDICSIYQVRDKKGKPVYPWMDTIGYRGFPWQEAPSKDK